MDYTLQVHSAKYVCPIPDGLRELSSDIIREVLRHQPEHINGFIADYLETMLEVRENARDAGSVVTDVLLEGQFYDRMYKLKKVNKTEVHAYATTIQAAWRGYILRKRVQEWVGKKKKFEEERIMAQNLRIEELLAGLGITYDEAKRAAETIQSAYKETKRGKWITGEMGEFWVAETIPFGQRLKEGDRVQGRYDRWEKQDFGEFFEMNEVGAIKYVWPRVGQVRRVLRDEVPPEVPIIEFFAMRDLDGSEQYSYLIKYPDQNELRGTPIGFIIPKLRTEVNESELTEVIFIDPHYKEKMGQYVYIFQDNLKREELKELEEIVKTEVQNAADAGDEVDPEDNWVLPRVLVRIKKDLLRETDYEMKFVTLPDRVVCEQEFYTFRAETLDQTLKVMRHILRNPCVAVQEGLVEAGNMKPYKVNECGRIFAVDKFTYPSYIQKIVITPESATAEEESIDLMLYSYIYLTGEYRGSKQFPKGEDVLNISVIRFQGYHSDYKGSAGMDDKVFIMGPKLPTPDGNSFTHESLFWNEFGVEAWYQLLFNASPDDADDADEDAADDSAENQKKGGPDFLTPSDMVLQELIDSTKPLYSGKDQTSDENLEDDEEEKAKAEDTEGEVKAEKRPKQDSGGEEKQTRHSKRGTDLQETKHHKPSKHWRGSDEVKHDRHSKHGRESADMKHDRHSKHERESVDKHEKHGKHERESVDKHEKHGKHERESDDKHEKHKHERESDDKHDKHKHERASSLNGKHEKHVKHGRESDEMKHERHSKYGRGSDEEKHEKHGKHGRESHMEGKHEKHGTHSIAEGRADPQSRESDRRGE